MCVAGMVGISAAHCQMANIIIMAVVPTAYTNDCVSQDYTVGRFPISVGWKKHMTVGAYRNALLCLLCSALTPPLGFLA